MQGWCGNPLKPVVPINAFGLLSTPPPLLLLVLDHDGVTKNFAQRFARCQDSLQILQESLL